jgi:hypothetical protein
MLARHSTAEELYKALAIVNKKYLGNVRFYEDPSKDGKGFRFRLKTYNSKEPGTARSWSKHTGSGCWHVHGDFFEALLKVNSEAEVVTRVSKITRDGGNWQDYNVGSQNDPLYASEACDCGFSQEITGKLSGEKELIKVVRAMTAEQIEKLIGYWNMDKFIIEHCAKEILPLYLNDENLKAIVCRRLRR